MATVTHLVDRPSWNCGVCRQPWPCPDARTALLAEFGEFRSVLTVYLAAQMQNAMVELAARGLPLPGDFYERFLSWAPRPSTPRAPLRARRAPEGVGIAAILPSPGPTMTPSRGAGSLSTAADHQPARAATPTKPPASAAKTPLTIPANAATAWTAVRPGRPQHRFDRSPGTRAAEGP
ncbi:hypothetical protein Ade02nite_07200 [Paractinoplanes deccanensis]|uniref:Flavin reductase n=1 Tax=Paractinoplanes deccanensis TaxID=113561 RepID=A0ABQ3XWE8_9ACTN|nr:hypothetical protein [Actinoplanes deccanensis]GID72079.1 hypothetical protein Ade02nite_07200 [Actinoplanes deccanensis]